MLEAEGTPTRVVSMPCVEWFHEQDDAYQQQVLPTGVKARVSVEAAVGMGWRDIVGDAGEIVSIEHFGASAAHTVLFEQFGFTRDRVVAAAHASLERVRRHHRQHHRQLTHRQPDRHKTEGAGPMTDPLRQLSDEGVAIWLDDMSRDRLTTGNLADLVRDKHVVGVTTNPTIFQKAISDSELYDEQLRDLAVRGVDVEEGVRMITTNDVRWACDVLRPVYDASGGVDGRVSIEVDPRLAHDTERTVAEARQLWWLVDRPNLFIKIPATRAACRRSRSASPRASASTSR